MTIILLHLFYCPNVKLNSREYFFRLNREIQKFCVFFELQNFLPGKISDNKVNYRACSDFTQFLCKTNF